MWAEINITPTPANATNWWFPQDSALTELHAARCLSARYMGAAAAARDVLDELSALTIGRS